MVERDRALRPEARLATELAALFNPQLYPGNREILPVSQEELASLVGLSRQRANQALKRLSARGLIRVDRRGVTILDLRGLGAFRGLYHDILRLLATNLAYSGRGNGTTASRNTP